MNIENQAYSEIAFIVDQESNKKSTMSFQPNRRVHDRVAPDSTADRKNFSRRKKNNERRDISQTNLYAPVRRFTIDRRQKVSDRRKTECQSDAGYDHKNIVDNKILCRCKNIESIELHSMLSHQLGSKM